MTPAEQSEWFVQQIRPYEPALRAYLSRRFPSVPDHDDLIQDAYLRTLRARQRGQLAFAKAFLFTTARNAAIDWLRRRRAALLERMPPNEEVAALDHEPDVAERIDGQEQLGALIEAVVALPERCREVMMLRYVDGFGSREIAAELGITPETVRVHLFKGVRACIEQFEQRGLMERSDRQRRRS